MDLFAFLLVMHLLHILIFIMLVELQLHSELEVIYLKFLHRVTESVITLKQDQMLKL